MPDAPKDGSQPLSAPELGCSIPAQPFSKTTSFANVKLNDGQSTALQGAALAFTSQVGKPTTRTGVKPGAAVNSNKTEARKAAILAGAANRVHADGQDGPIAGDVKGRIKQFSSQELMATSTSEPSPVSTNPQHVAAHLAVGRSASRTVVQQTDDGFTASLTNAGSEQLNDEQLNKNKTPLPARMQQFRSSTPSSIRHDHDEAVNPLRPMPPLANPQGNPQRKPALPPRNRPPSARNPGEAPLRTLPTRDTNVQTATGMVQARQVPLPVQRSQLNMRVPIVPSAPDALGDARVASSLASSRAPTPAIATPLPPPHRRTRSRSLLLRPAPMPRSDNSRTPSPSKSLRQTMRIESKSDNEGERKRSSARIFRPHSLKHSERGRKRWRDKVTERERKRYEGVWAANKGLLLHPEQHDMVVNVVVRDLWSRSRLAPRLLGCIWDLVSHDAQAMALSREEFVVGMWLIDQSLQGRKLPWKVADSVWDSVKQWSVTK